MLDLLLVKAPPTRGRKTKGIQLSRQLAKAYPLRPARADEGGRLPQARMLLDVLPPPKQALVPGHHAAPCP